MPIYRNGKAIKAFKGDYKPVNVYKGDVKVAGWDYAEQSGNALSADGTYNDTAYLKINGVSNQAQTVQGKNLSGIIGLQGLYNKKLKSSLLPIGTYTNITLSNGVYTVTNIGTQQYNAVHTGYIPVVSGLTYTVKIVSVLGLSYHAFMLCDANKNQVVLNTNNTGLSYFPDTDCYGRNTSIDPMPITIPEGVSYISYGIYMPPGTNNYIQFKELQIELGSTATTYTSFVPDSPSPSYPSTINSASNFNLLSNGKNLCPPFSQWILSNGAYIDGEWIVLPNGDSQAYIDIPWKRRSNVFYANFIAYSDIAGATPCILESYNDSLGNKISGNGYAPHISIGSEALVSYSLAGQALDSEYRVGLAKCDSVRVLFVRHGVNAPVPYKVKNVMFSTTNLPYEPYRGYETINSPYSLCSLPNSSACDYIEIDNVAKTAKLMQNIDKQIFNGAEAWQYHSGYSNTNYACFYCALALPYFGIPETALMTHFLRNVTTYQNTVNSESFYINWSASRFLFMKIKRTTATDVASFTTWLASQYSAGTPVTIQYQLQNPVITMLDYNIYKVLTYYPYTQISTNATVQPLLNGKFRIINT